MLRNTGREENGISKRSLQGIRSTFQAVHALYTKQPDHFMICFYYGSTQQQRPALYFNPQQQNIIVTPFDVLVLYSATENIFFLKIYISCIEYVVPSSPDFILNLPWLLGYFFSRKNYDLYQQNKNAQRVEND